MVSAIGMFEVRGLMFDLIMSNLRGLFCRATAPVADLVPAGDAPALQFSLDASTERRG